MRIDPNPAFRGSEERLVQERRERECQRKRNARKRQTPEQRKFDRERDSVRKREARKRQTPEQRKLDRERNSVRKREARKRQTPEQRERDKERERARSRKKVRPFWGVDGEGCGTDKLGRQHYTLMIASREVAGAERILHRKGKPLSVKECLEFILSLPAEPILVAFGFGYDATQILRGINHEPSLRRILNPCQGNHGPLYAYWGDYAILYQRGQFLRVGRLDRSGPKPVVLKGSCRTIHETLGFFQCSFHKALGNWKIGSNQERTIIAETKAHRAEFTTLTPEIIEYCKTECRSLASLMTAFRETCTAAGIFPKRWSGAGWLASALLDKHGVPKRPLTAREIAAQAEKKPAKNSKPAALRRPERDPAFEEAANLAFCGGRFETSGNGFFPGPLFEYDVNSAHPAAMLDLPCPLHTRWQHRPRAKNLPESGLYLAKVSFSHPAKSLWCGFPFRLNGGLFWPLQGMGWYWSPEIKAARRWLGADVVLYDLWVARCECDCRPFEWIRAIYDERQRLGKDTLGYPLKLVLNSLYGKMAQRCGRGPYHDAVAAGLITAITRARLIEAIGKNPKAVVMVATDSVFSTQPLTLDCGEHIGQWEMKIWPDLFIVKPGVYWSPTHLEKSLKTRGAPRSVIGPAAPRFHDVFNEWLKLMHDPAKMKILLEERRIPSVQVKVHIFNGCRLALARGKTWLAGKWQDVMRHESFEWKTKRDPMLIELDDGHIKTFPRALSILTESEGYQPADFDRVGQISEESGVPEEIDENTLFEGMQDFTPFLPHE
jgi:hypothetical protein